MYSSDGVVGELPAPISRWPAAGELSRRAEDKKSAVAIVWRPDAEVALITAADAGEMMFAERERDRFVVSTTRVMDPADPHPRDVTRQSVGPARNALDALCCAMSTDTEHPWRHRMTRGRITLSAVATRLGEQAEAPGVVDGAALTSDLTVGETVHMPSRMLAVRSGVTPGWRNNLWVRATLTISPLDYVGARKEVLPPAPLLTCSSQPVGSTATEVGTSARW